MVRKIISSGEINLFNRNRFCKYYNKCILNVKHKLYIENIDSEADLEMIRGRYTDFGTLFGRPKSRQVEKEKLTFCIKIKNCCM